MPNGGGAKDILDCRRNSSTRAGVVEILNLQPRNGGPAKAYQVRQTRNVIVTYKLSQAGPEQEGSSRDG